ncbi:MAG TPA: hypothetical protein VFW87_10830 [Pirellulales bacterium]|nr:hypothetical protein [Pirellulales bacterium]
MTAVLFAAGGHSIAARMRFLMSKLGANLRHATEVARKLLMLHHFRSQTASPPVYAGWAKCCIAPLQVV